MNTTQDPLKHDPDRKMRNMRNATEADLKGRLVMLDPGTDREAWLETRKDWYTATQAAAIVGSHPYAKMIDVWNEKTDPNYDREANRNKWLDERAELGVAREPEILKWASEDLKAGGPKNPFLPNAMLLATPEARDRHEACTPDGLKWAGPEYDHLVLIEAKATQQRWDEDGLPQHIYDQVQWQYRTTGAVTVWIAAEFYEWVGRGKNKHPELVGTWLHRVEPDVRRQEFIAQEVERFDVWLREGIAPESDLDLRELPEIDFDDDEETAAAKLAEIEHQEHVLDLLDELAELTEAAKAGADRMAEIKRELAAEVKAYDGRRVHLIGRRFIAKLVRFNKANVDTSALDPAELRRITSWSETERVSYDPNPEYTTTESE